MRYYYPINNLIKDFVMNTNYFAENFKFIIVDDGVEHCIDCKSIDFDDCSFQIKIKKSFLKRLLSCYSDENDSIVSSVIMTNRELEVLEYLAFGLNNNQISKKMNVSIHTIKAHLHNIFYKLSVKDRTQAVVKAIKDNLIDL